MSENWTFRVKYYIFSIFLLLYTSHSTMAHMVHIPASLPNAQVLNLSSHVDMNTFHHILKPLLVKRVVGSDSHEKVKNYIMDEMRKHGWSVNFDEFKDKTPNKGEMTFTNIISTFNGSSPRLLVFACHYDSKDTNFFFVGATDSAVPCAMLLYLAQLLPSSLKRSKQDVSLRFIFFDGEEAFVSWTSTDSVYGARHLAEHFESTPFQLGSFPATNELRRMDMLVLLDLLGTSGISFYNYFESTQYWYSLMRHIEQKLAAMKVLKYTKGDREYFTSEDYYDANIADDHEPFLKKGVPVLHIIPYPFPGVWHTPADNEHALDFQTIKNLVTIFQLFILEYVNGTSYEI